MKASMIEVWHGMGSITGSVGHDGCSGNAALSSIEIDFADSEHPSLTVENKQYELVQKLSLDIFGGYERRAFAEFLIAAGKELLEPSEQLGKVIHINREDGGYPMEEEAIEEEAPLPKTTRQEAGKEALIGWLKPVGMCYPCANQPSETFDNRFKEDSKLPDFLVLIKSLGMIAVYAKNRPLFEGEYLFETDSELQDAIKFERVFQIPVWYAYLGEQAGHPQAWYWIKADKVAEAGRATSGPKGKDVKFLGVKRKHFKEIEQSEDLGKFLCLSTPCSKADCK